MTPENFVNRYLYKDGEQQYTDNRGFLCGRMHYQDTKFVLTMDDYVQFEDIKNNPYTFIIGNGGIGKSTYITQIQEKLERENIPFIRINLRDISQEKTLTEKILPFCISNKNLPECFILLDALDEAIDNKICNPNAMIQDAISECFKQSPNIKTILTCRDNRFLINVLPEFFKKIYNCKYDNIFHLCSLTQDNAKEIAEKLGCKNVEDFMNKILDYNLGYFASSPITIEPLVLLYNSGSLENNINHFDIYENLMLDLASETEYRARKSENRESISVTSSSILLSIASKIATELKFSKKNYVTTNPNDKEGFYIENFININIYDNDKKIYITKEALLETLLTKIFYKSDSKYHFAQQTYQDYLVARYLLNLKLKTREILNLLKVNGTFHPYLNEVIAFISIKNKKIFNIALKDIPDKILFSSVYFIDNNSKKMLFDKYIECASKDNISFWDYSFNRTFFHKRLYFSGIEKRLKRYLKSHDINICDTAIDFISDNMLQGFEESFENLFFKSKTPITIKVAILNACENCDYKNLLKNISDNIDKFKDEIDHDNNDQLRGAILNALYPDYVECTDVFNFITEPKDKNYYGRYEDFLKHKFVEMVIPQNAILYLEWIKNNKIKGVTESIYNEYDYTDIVNNIFNKIIKLLTFEIINKVIEMHISKKHNYHFFSEKILQSILNNNNFRIYFFKNLILKESNFENFKTFISFNSHILYNFDDIAVFMEFYQNNEFQEKQDYIRFLLNSYYRPFINDSKTDIDTIYNMIISDSVLNEQFRYYIDSRPISSDTGEPIEEMDIFIKEDYYKKIEKNLERQREDEEIKELNNIEYQINTILNSENDNIKKVIAIFEFLDLEKNSKQFISNNFDLDIKSHERWNDISDNTKNNIINVVTDYLLNEINDGTILKNNYIKHNTCFSNWRCFALLQQIKDINREAYKKIIHNWFEIIIFLPTHTEQCVELKSKFIEDLYFANKKKLISVLDKIITNCNNQLPMNFLQSFKLVSDTEIFNYIFESYCINEQNFNENIVLDLLEFLAERNYEQLVPYLKNHIKNGLKQANYKRVSSFLNILLYHYKNQWNYVYKVLKQSKNFDILISTIANRHFYEESYSRQSLFLMLKPEELASLYNITVNKLKYVNTEHELGIHNVDRVKDLIEKIPNYLIEKGCINAYKKIKKEYLINRSSKKIYKKYYDRGLRTLKYNIAKNLDLNKIQLEKVETKINKERNCIVQIGKNNIVGDNTNITENNNGANFLKIGLIFIGILALVLLGLGREQIFELIKIIIHIK